MSDTAERIRSVMTSHDARVRYCIELGIERQFLRDDIRCPACDENHALMHLDPGVTEILAPRSWCESCVAGDKITASSIPPLALRGRPGV